MFVNIVEKGREIQIDSKYPIFIAVSAPKSENSRAALKPINGPALVSRPSFKKTKQVRVRFSEEQRKYLMEKFAKNPRPNQGERLEIAKYLGVNMRTVVIFFSNRRSRLCQNNSPNNDSQPVDLVE